MRQNNQLDVEGSFRGIHRHETKRAIYRHNQDITLSTELEESKNYKFPQNFRHISHTSKIMKGIRR